MSDGLAEAYNKLYLACGEYLRLKRMKGAFSLYDICNHEDDYLDLEDMIYVASEEMKIAYDIIHTLRKARKTCVDQSDTDADKFE